jgi:hypothetical protein
VVFPVAILLLSASWLLFAATATNTWTGTEWDTDWTGVTTTNNCDIFGIIFYNESSCDGDSSCFYGYCEGRSDELFGYALWTGAWTDLGVTGGNVVSSIQMTDVRTRCIDYSTCLEATIGPFELRDSSDALVSTMWSGRTASSAEGSYTTEGSQSAVGCGSICAAASSIELWFHWTLDTGNAMNALCTFWVDELDISIEHDVAATGILRRRPMTTKVRFGIDDEGKVAVVSSDTRPADSD